ncbi:unnamed protein product, partial [Effrenium voratum]
ARGQQSVVLRASPAQHGGQPWSRLNAQSRQVLGQGSRLRRLQFRHPALPENAPQTAEWPEQVEGEALMKIIWSDELLQDDESGVNRQLGFVFLYMVLLGQLSLKLCGLDVSGSLGPLLARVFHLKLARWGKELVEEGESEPQVSRAMATLAMMVRGQGAGWPPLPSAQRAQLAAGLNLYDAQGRESPLKHWLDTVDRIFQQSLAEAAPPRPPGEEWAPASTVQLPNLREPVLLRRAKDETCSSRQLPPPLATLAKGEILATLQLQRFVSLQEALPVEGTSPFDLAGHVGARSLVAQDLLRRLKEDCARYGEMLSQRRRPVLSADPAALAELEEALRRSAEEDYAELRSATGELQEKANFLRDGQDEIFDFELQRDLCRLEERVSFAYAMSCITSAHAQEELLRLNPFASDTDLVLSLSLKVALLSQRLLQSRRAAQLCRAARRNSAESPEAGLELRQQCAQLAELLCEQRCYLQDARGFDPRYLIFEFMQQIVLRPRQVEMVDWFMKSHREGESRVQQMIMGAGKTTVVGPLLSLMLASPEVLVTQVMPSPLLDQTRQILRACFARLLPKRIVTFQFDRQVEDCPETVMKLYTKLEACRRAGGIVCSSPEAIKSMMLKLIEQLHALSSYDFSQLAPGAANRSNRDMVRQREVLERRSGMADAAVQLLKLWRTGIVIMDEVDVLLHPLKSELNFPIGFRDPIDLSGHRWNLPIHIIEGLFAEQKSDDGDTVEADMASDPQHPGHQILQRLQQALRHGFQCRALQRTPHAVLLDNNFYQKTLKLPFAQWVLLWLKKNFVGKCTVAEEVLLEVLTCEQHLGYKEVLEAGLTPFSLKLLLLASSWLRAVLPHVLSKIDRVSYGLLRQQQLQEADEKTPFSRLVMAVPFVGKDVPSRSSEFAHPDVAIGLTILAYRYEGLRLRDTRSIVAQLKQDCSRQMGPRDTRPAHLLFESWVREPIRSAPGSPRHKMRRLDCQNILPLSLFQPTDPKQMGRLHQQVQSSSCVAHFWLRQHVFPVTMNFHPVKISAAGHELGSALLFGYRLGFSGTPSNLLPEDLGECFYEPGSDGQVTAVLTDPAVTTAEVCPADWSPGQLLERVASGAFHALIDTGALITNMDNEQVARELLAKLPAASFDGVVFLDQSDRKMILVRPGVAAGRRPGR